MSQIGALFSGLFGDAGQSFTDEQGGASKVFGSKPKVADFVPVDLSDETAKALAGNTENFGAIKDLLDKIYPGFSDILAQGSSNTLSELQGQLPADVQDQVYRSAAFKSLAGGYAGTPMASALTARDLGRTSLDLTQIGTNSAQQWANIAEEAFSPWEVSTGEQAATTAANNAGKQAQEQFQYNVDAAPDPGAAGVFNLDAALGEQLLSIGGAALGGVGGSGGGGGTPKGGSTPIDWSNFTGNIGQGAGSYAYNPATGQFQPTTQATGAWSDGRLKENLSYIRTSPQGHRVYHYNYKGRTTKFEGVIAQEVRAKHPEAVYDDGEGYLRVNYNLIDVQFRVVHPERELNLEAA